MDNTLDKIEVEDKNIKSENNENNNILETYELEKIKNCLEAKQLELLKWEEELVKKEKEIEIENIRLQRENLKLEEQEKNAQEKISLKIEKEYLDSKVKLAEEQAKIREEFVLELERKRKEFDKFYQESLNNLDKELQEKRKNINLEFETARKKQDEELEKMRIKTEEDLKKNKKEYLEQLELEIKDKKSKLDKYEEKLLKEKEVIDKESAKVQNLELKLIEKENNLKNMFDDIEIQKIRLERKRDKIEEQESNLEDVVNESIEDTIKKLNQKIETKDKELDSLREELKNSLTGKELIKSFYEAYGKEPIIIRETIKQLEQSNKNLRDELSNSASKLELNELYERNKDLEERAKRLSEENINLKENQEEYIQKELECRRLFEENKQLKVDNEIIKNLLDRKNNELIRLTKPEAIAAERDERISAIMTGALDDNKDLIGANDGFDSRTNAKDEIKWLDGIWNKCKEYGMKFNRRILYAFHTALKINEWSTITVLAGVSGTGKSELPRLYSEFGGLNFCSASVQPNWDSQESMLGFFNSIDNRFEPQELLKFLVQCTEDSRYRDYMSVVLLDEMNLAHVEHYFAEFLSKLESRRGSSKKYLPEIEVKLGAGVEPYMLKLSRTLLWVGTMNQDETTKSLSDKVLDRGIIINFPRPTKLESRNEMKIIAKYIGNRPKLHKETWMDWTTYKIEFSDEQMKEINKYKEIVEKINDALQAVGRALGHRVWQSIEYYIANYPTVRQALNYEMQELENGKKESIPTNIELTEELRDAMKIAFEDQIVQKIMPKLRGIETRDKRGKSSLDKIEELLVNYNFTNLQEDFQIAREQGYGQFIWNSAKYLEKVEEDK